MSILVTSPNGSKSISRSDLRVVCSLKLTTNSVSDGSMFLRRSSSLRLTLPSPLANSTRRAGETYWTLLARVEEEGARKVDEANNEGAYIGWLRAVEKNGLKREGSKNG
jgi:hypothetical protein